VTVRTTVPMLPTSNHHVFVNFFAFYRQISYGLDMPFERAKQMAGRRAINMTYQKAIDCKTLQRGQNQSKRPASKKPRDHEPGLRETVQDDDKERG